MVLSALKPYAFCVTFVLHTLLAIYIYIYIYIVYVVAHSGKCYERTLEYLSGHCNLKQLNM